MKAGWVALLLLLVLSISAQAQTPPKIDPSWCDSPSATDAQTIQSCTMLINSNDYDAYNLAAIYKNRALAYDDMGQFDLAIADYNMAVKLFPVYADGFKSRGDAYYDTHQYNLAIQDYTTAIGIDPQFGEAYNNRGIVEKLLGQTTAGDADVAKGKQLGFAPQD